MKRSGHSEPYLEEKLHESVHAAILSVRSLEGEAALLASRVCRDVLQWCEGKAEVTSRDIQIHAAVALSALHPEAAYAYVAHDSVL